MQNVEDFKPANIPFHDVLFSVTSPSDYEMSRIVLVENWGGDYDKYAIVEGYHCSCYGFDDTTWDATVYTSTELERLLANWLGLKDRSDAKRRQLARLYFTYIGQEPADA